MRGGKVGYRNAAAYQNQARPSQDKELRLCFKNLVFSFKIHQV